MTGSIRGRTVELQRWLPEGRLLGDDVWRLRHRAIVWLLWLHVPALAAFGVARGKGVTHSLIEVLMLAAIAGVAASESAPRRLRSLAGSIGLVTCSAMLVHLWDGRTEAHFHFFVVVSLLVLYQDWLPFGLAVIYVVAHHWVLGAIDPAAVYDHPDAVAQPWFWALVHGGFVLAACAANIVSWRAAEQLLRDPLTGLARRMLFDDRLMLARERSRRTGRLLAVVFIDLDGFKDVNDAYGHTAGDRLIALLARRISGACRATDTPVRYGGDEFVVLCEDVNDPADANAFGRRLAAAVAEPCDVQGRVVTVTASVGVAVGDARTASADELVAAADAAMYRAKQDRRAPAPGRARTGLFARAAEPAAAPAPVD